MIKLKSLFRRGQSGSPSGSNSSKNNQSQVSPAHSVGIKNASSATSLDRAGSASAELGATRKLSKNHKQSSKDKLNDLLRVSSKEKLIDEKKELKKQQKLQQKQQQQQQMQQVAQQTTNVHLPTVVASSGHLSNSQHSGRSNSKDFDVVTFEEVQDVSFYTLFSILVAIKTQKQFFTGSDSQHDEKKFHFQFSFKATKKIVN